MVLHPPTESNRDRRYRVLIADDDDRCRDSLSALLDLEGYRTLHVAGGKEALEALEALSRARRIEIGPRTIRPAFDFLILDYNMPDLSGVEVLRRMRFDLQLRLPTILVSGDFSPQLERDVRQAGGHALLPKPVEPLSFRAVVRELVRNHFQ